MPERIPSTEDVEALRILMGGAIDGSLAKFDITPQRKAAAYLGAYKVTSSDGLSTYVVEKRLDTKHGGYYLFCPCPAWKYRGQTCKHTQEAIWQFGVKARG